MVCVTPWTPIVDNREENEAMSQNNDLLVEVKHLRIQFPVRDGVVKAVDGATFDIRRGQTLGIIGESGCGKSIAAKALLNMVPKPGRIVEGEIIFHRKVSQNGS